MYYFLAKGITLRTLETHNITLIPCHLNPSPPALEALPGHEPRPPNSSLPILRIVRPNGQIVWIRESLSILEYLEDLFPSSAGWPDLRGETAEQRAQTRDLAAVLDDAVHWSLVQLVHSDARTTSWSGLAEEDMSASAARHAQARCSFYLERLGEWVHTAEWEGVKSMSLVCLMGFAQVEYHRETYGGDWVQGNGVLGQWVEGMRKEKWAVSCKKLKGPESGDGWGVLLGDG